MRSPCVIPATARFCTNNFADRCIQKNLDELDEHGFTIVENIFTPEQLIELKRDYETIR